MALFFSFLGNAQEPFLRKMSFLEGSPSDVIYDMYVSKKGLLYLGTDKGLVSFDGVHFLLYPFDTNLSNSVNSIQEDTDGVIYCKNFSNQIYKLQNDRLCLDRTYDKCITSKKLTVIEFSVLGNQKILLTNNEIYVFIKEQPKLIYRSKRKGDKNDFFHMVYDSKKHQFYVSGLMEILVFKGQQLVQTRTVNGNQRILEMHQNQIAYCTKGKENEIMVADVVLDTKPMEKTNLNKLSSCGEQLWGCTNDGVFAIDLQDKSVKNPFLIGKRISDVVQDKEGNYWISTLDNGLYLMPDKNLKSLRIKEIEEQKKPNFSRVKIAKNGHFFVATTTGCVFEFDAKGKQILKYQSENKTEIEFITLHQDWIITSAGVFTIGNPQPISDKKMYLGKEVVLDNHGNFFLASSSFAGLLSKNFKSGLIIPKNFENYKLLDYGHKANTLCFRERRARTVFFDAKTTVYYVAYNDDLYYYDKSGVGKSIKLPNQEPIIASEIVQHPDGSLWVATTQNGVLQIKNQKIAQHITMQQKLSSNNARRIEIDGDNLWILNDKGLEIYNFKTGSVKNASANLCMKGITINDFIIKENIVAFITNEGVFYSNKSIVQKKYLPQLEFRNIWINNQKIPFKKELLLNYDQNNIQIDFRTIHYKSLGDYTYEYRFKNQGSKWYNLTSDASNVKLVSLNSGNYIFQIRVKYGDSTSKIQELHFEVKKPFWLQWWFLFLEFLVFCFVLYMVNKAAVLRTKKRQEIKEQLALSQLTALRSQMNPHFMFNVLNSVQGLIYSNQKSKASDFLGKFSDLMRKILDASDKKEISVAKEFEMLDLYISLEKSRFEGDFAYEIRLPETIDLKQYTIPSMIIQPYVENAIKHGLMHKSGEKKLWILGEIKDNFWHFVIEDNGVGREKADFINQSFKKHQSFATKAIENRITLMNKTSIAQITIKIDDKVSKNNEPLGTKITLLVPVKRIY